MFLNAAYHVLSTLGPLPHTNDEIAWLQNLLHFVNVPKQPLRSNFLMMASSVEVVFTIL